MYNKKLGRFYSVDPQNYQAFQNISNPQSWNAYAYVNNNPCNDIDPTGMGCDWCQKLKNFVGGYGWRTNQEVEQLTQEKAAFLQEMVSQAGSITVTSRYTGSQFVLNSESVSKLSQSNIWYYADDLRAAMEDGRLTANGDFAEVTVSSDPDIPIPEPAAPTLRGATVLTGSQAKAIRKIRNNIDNHLTEKDLQALIRDLSNNPLVKSRGDAYQHYKEVTNAVKGLKKGIKSLENAMKNPNLSQQARTEMQQAVQEAKGYVERVEKIIRSH